MTERLVGQAWHDGEAPLEPDNGSKEGVAPAQGPVQLGAATDDGIDRFENLAAGGRAEKDFDSATIVEGVDQAAHDVNAVLKALGVGFLDLGRQWWCAFFQGCGQSDARFMS